MEIDDPRKEDNIKRSFWTAMAVLFIAVVVYGMQRNIRSAMTGKGSEFKNEELEELKAENPGNHDLKIVENHMLGVRFSGNFGWQVDEVKDKMALYHIKDNPKIEFMIFRFGIDLILVEQLSRYRLENMAKYADNFAMEMTEVAGKKALKIKAYKKDDPDTRLLDYYFLRWENNLFALMFSVKPKSEWENYQYLFQDIVDSFEFMW